MKIMSWFNEFEETFEFVKCEPVLEFLPMELLVKIFSFLNPSDLMCVGLTCQRFLDTTQYRPFSKHWALDFSERYSNESIPIQFFAKCKRLFPTVILHTAQVDDYATEDFFIDYGEKLTELHFLSGLLRKDEFISVVKYTPKLRAFNIEANNMFKSWTFNKFTFERRVVLPSCSHVGLARNNFMSPDVFDYLVTTSPNLTSLDLSNCFLLMNPPERNQMLDFVLAFIRSNSTKIKSLNFANTATDDLFLDKLGRIDHLSLKHLHLTFMGSTKNINYGLPVLIKSQRSLEFMDLTASPCADDVVLRLIAAHAIDLKILLLKKCHLITDNGVREISKLVRLQKLEISDCDHVNDVGIMDGILLGTPKAQLTELCLGFLQNLTEAVILRMSYVYEKITVLDLGGVSLAVTDSSLQMIFRHMRLLRMLNVDSCCKLTDFAFCGITKETEYKRRHHSIRNERGLQVLRCNGLYKLTDFTLIDAFMLKELKEVHFARCNFSFEGIKSLVTNCPSIEFLDLSECKDVNDDCVNVITKALPRLKTIKLNGCDKITETSIEAIYQNCSQLRNLFMRNCKLQFDPSDRLKYMSCLRKAVV